MWNHPLLHCDSRERSLIADVAISTVANDSVPIQFDSVEISKTKGRTGSSNLIFRAEESATFKLAQSQILKIERRQMRKENHADMTTSDNEINPACFLDQIPHLHAEVANIASPKKYETWIDGTLKCLFKQMGSLSILCRRHSGGISVMRSHASGVGDIAREIACGPFNALSCPYVERWLDYREVLCMGKPFPNALSHERWILELSASNALPGCMSGSIDNPSKSFFFFYLFGVPSLAMGSRQFKEFFAYTTNLAHVAFLRAHEGCHETRPKTPSNQKKSMTEVAPALVLSPAEAGIATLVCQGLPTKAIAKALNKSPNTVSKQLHAIFKRNNIRTRTELAFLCTTTKESLNKSTDIAVYG